MFGVKGAAHPYPKAHWCDTQGPVPNADLWGHCSQLLINVLLCPPASQ